MLRRTRVSAVTGQGWTTPVWNGAVGFRDGYAKHIDIKSRKGGLPAFREDWSKPYNHDPYDEQYVGFYPKKQLPSGKDDLTEIEKTQIHKDNVEIPSYTNNPRAWFEKGKYAPVPEKKNPKEPAGTADLVRTAEFDTAFGKFEVRPSGTGHVGVLRYHNYRREPPRETILSRETWGMSPRHEGHHPFLDYSANAGHKEGYNQGVAQANLHWDVAMATHSLYRASMRIIPMVKHFYQLSVSLETMAERVKLRFRRNRYVQDPDAIRHLLNLGWQEYTEIVNFRKTRAGVHKYFHDSEDHAGLISFYTEEEGKLMSEKAFWNGEEQRKNGPYDGHWSWIGKKNQEEFEKLAGRVPMSWSAGKGYFELFKADGTQFWERNLDYEGWYIKNTDPDRAAARREIQTWVDSGYATPKHYQNKNRRGYRRLVKDIENIMKSTPHEMYAESRELLFQFWVREWSPESNRIAAEKRLARHDDEVFTTKFDELEKPLKQAMREMPNPRLWRTDAFYLRMRYLQGFYEYNWAKVPIGTAFEKAYNEWVSVDANYAIICSPQFDAVKADKARNPMARTWADFYREFDPDVEATRRLPWYHAEFDYDRRHHWDERCMRMKKWIDSGDIDGVLPFFDSEVAKFEQHINRFDTCRFPGSVEYKYCAPRYVQLYRGLAKRNDVALANQMREHLEAKKFIGGKATVAEVSAALEKNPTAFADFKFAVPVVIYPDNIAQPQLELDGRPSKVQTAQ